MSNHGYYHTTTTRDANTASQMKESTARFQDSVLPEESSSASLNAYAHSEVFHINVATHHTLLASYHDEEDFMRSGVANPNEVQPPTNELESMSLFDIQDPIQFQDGPLNFDRYPLDIEDPPITEGAVGFTSTPLKPQMAFDDCRFPTSIHQTSNRDPWAQSIAGLSPSLHNYPPTSSSFYPSIKTKDSASQNHHLLPNMYAESDEVSTNSRSRRRHERVQGLPEEEQKKRSQHLNNEASRLYRLRKAKKIKHLERQIKQEEDRNAQLKMIYRRLQEQKQRLIAGQSQLDWPNTS